MALYENSQTTNLQIGDSVWFWSYADEAKPERRRGVVSGFTLATEGGGCEGSYQRRCSQRVCDAAHRAAGLTICSAELRASEGRTLTLFQMESGE